MTYAEERELAKLLEWKKQATKTINATLKYISLSIDVGKFKKDHILELESLRTRIAVLVELLNDIK